MQLHWVKFRPLQEIEAIMGVGDTGPFFARLQYVQNNVMVSTL